MMIKSPGHTLAARSFLPADAGEQTGAIERMLKRIQVVVCALHGHDSVVQYERNRLFLLCTSCGHETKGWEVTPAALVRTRRPEATPARRTTPGFGIVRRIA
jgi:hypothetical protein